MTEQSNGDEGRPGPDTDLRATVWALADADDALFEDAKLAVLEAPDNELGQGRRRPVPGVRSRTPCGSWVCR